MKKRFLIPAIAGLAAVAAQAQTPEIFIARHSETENGLFNQGRVRISATFDGTVTTQWGARGNAGTVGDGSVWHAFTRFKMFERDLFSKIDTAGQITWTTGLIQKEKNRAVDAENGGHDVDVYLVLDPDGTFVPSGSMPDYSNAWDWANEFGLGYENTVYLGRVPQSEPMATDEEKDAENQIPLDSPAMRITFDLTQTLKEWIQQGLITENSTIAIGLVQRQAEIVDDQGNPRFDDPNLYIHSQMVFEIGNAHLAVSAGGGAPKGPGIFSDLDLVDGYVDSGDWLGRVEVSNYPWCYVVSLGRYIYATEPAGWVFLPK